MGEENENNKLNDSNIELDEERSTANSYVHTVGVKKNGDLIGFESSKPVTPAITDIPREIAPRSQPTKSRDKSAEIPADIKLRPDLVVHVDPPINVVNFMKKNSPNPLSNVKFDEGRRILKNRYVKKAVGNFDLGEQHLLDKSFEEIKSMSLKNFQILNQYKLGTSPMAKREMLQKIIVDDKLAQEKKKLQAKYKLSPSNSPSPKRGTTADSHFIFEPNDAEVPQFLDDDLNLHDYLTRNGKPISFLPTNFQDVSRLNDVIKSRKTPVELKRAHNMTYDNIIGNNNKHPKKVTVKPKSEPSFNPKKQVPMPTLALYTPKSPVANTSDIILSGRSHASHGSLHSQTSNNSKQPGGLGANGKPTDLKVNINQSDEIPKTPLYSPATYRRPKILGEEDARERERSPGSPSPPKSPLVAQTEKWLEKMKSVSFDEDGNPKGLKINTSSIISDELSSAGASLDLSVAAKIPKTPQTPGGSKRKKMGEAIENLVRSPSHQQQQQQAKYRQEQLTQLKQYKPPANTFSNNNSQVNISLDSRRPSTQPIIQQQTVSLEKTNNHLTEKNKLHCVDCYKEAELWCPQCMKAFCPKCWNRATHHTLFNMKPITNIDKDDYKVRSVHHTTPKHSTNLTTPMNKSYSNTILFATYKSDNDLQQLFFPTDEMIDPRIGTQQKPAPVPRDERVVIEYQDYPNPPVYLDGRGNVHEVPGDESPLYGKPDPNRPVSPFHPLSGQKVLVRTLSPPITYDVKVAPKNQSALRHFEGKDFQGKVSSTFHYVSPAQYSQEIANLQQQQQQQQQKPGTAGGGKRDSANAEQINKVMSRSKSTDEGDPTLRIGTAAPAAEKEIKVRRDPYKHRKKPKTAFSVGANGVSITMSNKPNQNMVPMKGVTHELIPIDWKDGFFRVKNMQTHYHSNVKDDDDHSPTNEKKKKNDRSLSPSTLRKEIMNPPHEERKGPELYDVKPREVNLFNGIPVFTTNYKK